MYLKRHYDPTGKKVISVDVLRHTKEWRPSERIVNEGLRQGWLRREPEHLVIVTHGNGPDVRYRLLAPPGTYCCHCGEPLEGSRVAEAHVLREHSGVKSPSDNNPSGFAKHNFWMCELEEDNG